MNLTEVKKSLERQFDRELAQGSVRNIVFWYDEEGVFTDSIDTLELDNVKLVKLYANNMFAVNLFAKFQTSFYTSPEDAVFKALGLE
jgi:hypothetical protein